MNNPYLDLTEELNRGRLRTLLSSGQAVVVHRLAIMSKESLRIRTDFVTRPPRIAPEQLAQMWQEAQASGDDVVRLEPLAAMKLTNRDKDYAVVGELARLMTDPRSQLRYSRSSRDLIKLAEEHPEALAEAARQRPLLARIGEGREALEEALDRERRALIRANEERLARYMAASEGWAKIWPEVQRQIEGLSLPEAHRLVVSRAEGVLPFEPAQGADS